RSRHWEQPPGEARRVAWPSRPRAESFLPEIQAAVTWDDDTWPVFALDCTAFTVGYNRKSLREFEGRRDILGDATLTSTPVGLRGRGVSHHELLYHRDRHRAVISTEPLTANEPRSETQETQK